MSRGQADMETVRQILAGELPEEAIRAWVSVLRKLMREEQNSVNEIGDSVFMSCKDFIEYHNYLSTSFEEWTIVDRLYPCSTKKYVLNCGTPIPVHPTAETMFRILDQHEHKEKLMNVVTDVATLTEGRRGFEWIYG